VDVFGVVIASRSTAKSSCVAVAVAIADSIFLSRVEVELLIAGVVLWGSNATPGVMEADAQDGATLVLSSF